MIDIGIHHVTGIELGQILVWNNKSVTLIIKQKNRTAAEISLWGLPDNQFISLLQSIETGNETTFQEERYSETYRGDLVWQAIGKYCREQRS